jgi:O-antigen/teichoic acid export membrane protein
MKKNNIDAVAAKAGTWYTIANLLLKGVAFFSLPIFTRLLSTEDFGIYNTYIAYESILTAILGLGLYGTVKNAKLDYKALFEKYLSSVAFLSILVLAFILTIANVFYALYADLLGFSRFETNCLILQSFGSYIIFFYGSKLNIEFKYKSYITISFLNTIGNVLLSILLIKYVFPYQRYLGRILGSAIPLITIGIILSAYLILKGKTLYNKQYWNYALRLGLPLVPHVISQSLLTQFDRIMISSMIGHSEAGIYSYIYTICTITYVICSSLDNAWTPWVFLNIAKGERQHIKDTSKQYVDLFMILSLGFICIMPEFTKLIADRTYWGGIDLLIPLTLANYFVFLYMLPVNIEYYNKKTKLISVGTMGAAATNAILNYIAITIWGYKAAAYTTLASYMLLFIFHWLIAKKYDVDTVYDIKSIARSSAVLIFISFTILFTMQFEIFNIIYRYAIALTLIVILLKNTGKLKNILISN